MNIEKLEKLNELKEKGIITQDEFNKQKQDLLSDNKSENKPKKQSVFLWLAVFLGLLGIHNFYIGEKLKGFIKLSVCLFGAVISTAIDEGVLGTFLNEIVFRLPIYIWIIIEIFNTNKTSSGIDLIPTTKTFRNTLGGIYCGFVGIGTLYNLLILTGIVANIQLNINFNV